MTGKVPSFSPGSTVSSALPGYVTLCLALQVHRLASGLGSAPVISVEGHQDGGIRVVCRSAGWYPEPKAQWRDLQGQLLPSASEKISPDANGLFQAEIAIVLTEESNQKVSCCVRTPRLNQERESAISIAELFFPRVNPWMVALWVILAVLIPLAGYCFRRQHRAKAAHRAEKKTLQGELSKLPFIPNINLVTKLSRIRSVCVQGRSHLCLCLVSEWRRALLNAGWEKARQCTGNCAVSSAEMRSVKTPPAPESSLLLCFGKMLTNETISPPLHLPNMVSGSCLIDIISPNLNRH
ncbi:putative butyrophilin subfamily 2 member A3 isoform X2 [Chelonoidis abingdonii]|uniref:putative butyrophilin subfamily 2 member A3 isoform X2 n=1 Tax=Chelonoidis abingdonii TaxID=106734 RepID=UPI003F49134C